MEVELIPVIELPVRQAATAATAPGEWQANFDSPSDPGYGQFRRFQPSKDLYEVSQRVSQLDSAADLLKIVHHHLGGDDPHNRTAVSESCALFGGYILRVDGQIMAVPQCCGTLADFASWEQIVDDSFTHAAICPDGHPCPQVTRRGDVLDISFDDQWESFAPPAVACSVASDPLQQAIIACRQELADFATRLDALGPELGHENVSQILIHELS